MNPPEYVAEVKRAIRMAILDGFSSLEDICPRVAGADPRLVAELLNVVCKEDSPEFKVQRGTAIRMDAESRRNAATLPLRLPAADPLNSQWWYTLDTVVGLSRRVACEHENGRVAFLGTPTIADHFSHRYKGEVTVFDSDPDVVSECNGKGVIYSAQEPLPDIYRNTFSVVVIDPPWYPDLTRMFIKRSRELLSEGLIFCTLPSRLTRPALVEERTELIDDLIRAKFQIVGLELGAVCYRVPLFEVEAFEDVKGFSGQPWRTGDLLIIRVINNTENLTINSSLPPIRERFARHKPSLRCFLQPDRVIAGLQKWIESVTEFESHVSSRAFDENQIGAWTSSRRGARIRDANVIRLVLSAWENKKSSSDAVEDLVVSGLDRHEAKTAVQEAQEALGIWIEETSLPRRTPEAMTCYRNKIICDFVPPPSAREHGYKSDRFRLEYQRDRDRVIWSQGLRKLANKTQVFSSENDDHVRQRLAHSMEVMQLATTIGSSFGLDRDLIEAGALAHDIGHAPFGHAGEYAINSLLNKINEDFGGFNHYEHGVDVVRWLEDIYQSPASDGFPGLNLTKEVCETIFKHTFALSGHRIAQDALFRSSKHIGFFAKGACHLEGQAIRVGDKVSYLISDLEDGIRMGVIRIEHLQLCRLFSRPPIDIVPSVGESLYERFISQRRAILQVLMEDIILETEKRLIGVKTLADVRSATRYTIDHSPDVCRDVQEVYVKLQAGLLHRDGRVVAANALAARIVGELVLFFAMFPDLVDQRFSHSHEQVSNNEYGNYYIARCGEILAIPTRLIASFFYEHTIGRKLPGADNVRIPTRDLLMAVDYVAGFTDSRARQMHRHFLSVN